MHRTWAEQINAAMDRRSAEVAGLNQSSLMRRQGEAWPCLVLRWGQWRGGAQLGGWGGTPGNSSCIRRRIAGLRAHVRWATLAQDASGRLYGLAESRSANAWLGILDRHLQGSEQWRHPADDWMRSGEALLAECREPQWQAWAADGYTRQLAIGLSVATPLVCSSTGSARRTGACARQRTEFSAQGGRTSLSPPPAVVAARQRDPTRLGRLPSSMLEMRPFEARQQGAQNGSPHVRGWTGTGAPSGLLAGGPGRSNAPPSRRSH